MDAEALESLRRESGLRVDADGGFHHQEGPVPNPRVQTLFHAGLRVREDGEVVVHVGQQWAYVACDDVARFVSSIICHDDELRISLLGNLTKSCVELKLAFAPNGRCYLWEDEGAYAAVLLRGAHQRLGARLNQTDAGQCRAEFGDFDVPVLQIDRTPGPAERWQDMGSS